MDWESQPKISFGLYRKSPKFQKYIDFKPFKLHLIHRTIHVTAKIKYGTIMVLVKPHCKVRC